MKRIALIVHISLTIVRRANAMLREIVQHATARDQFATTVRASIGFPEYAPFAFEKYLIILVTTICSAPECSA